MSKAKSWRGLWGNIRFIVGFKTWAALVIFTLGLMAGSLLCSWPG